MIDKVNTGLWWTPENIAWLQKDFVCQRCGKCETGFSKALVEPDEALDLSQHLSIELGKFYERYCMLDRQGAALVKATAPIPRWQE